MAIKKNKEAEDPKLSPFVSFVQNPYLGIVGIFVLYLYYGVLQERIYKPTEDGTKFDFSIFLLVAMCSANLVVAVLGIVGLGGSAAFQRRLVTDASASDCAAENKDFLQRVAISGVSYALAMLCSNMALLYVSYPTQALFKSVKLLPVMIGTIVIGGETLSRKQKIAVTLVVTGILLYRMAKIWKSLLGLEESRGKDSVSESSESLFGLLLLFGSLGLDGMTTGNQSHLKKGCGGPKPRPHELMFWTNFWGLLTMVVAGVYTGDIVDGLSFVSSHPDILQDILAFCVCSAFGQNFIFSTLTGWGPLVTTMITTSRKFLTILLSVLLFNNKLLPMQWAGVFVVFAGLAVDISDKYEKKKTKEAGATRETEMKND